MLPLKRNFSCITFVQIILNSCYTCCLVSLLTRLLQIHKTMLLSEVTAVSYIECILYIVKIKDCIQASDKITAVHEKNTLMIHYSNQHMYIVLLI